MNLDRYVVSNSTQYICRDLENVSTKETIWRMFVKNYGE